MLTEKQLLNLKVHIEEANNKLNQLAGQKKVLLQSLKKEFNCTSIEEAEKIITKFEKQLDTIDKNITKLSNKLETQLEIE